MCNVVFIYFIQIYFICCKRVKIVNSINGLPRSKLLVIKELKQIHLQVLTMQFFVIFFISSLVFCISSCSVFITLATYCAHEIAFGSKLAAPQLFFYHENFFKHFSVCYTLDYSCYFCWAITQDQLYPKVYIIFLNPDFNRNNLITLGYLKANFPDLQVGLIAENNPPVFGETHQMIK
jgi:hypothetical protein